MYKKVVCIIVTYNAVKWIEKCISTIQEDKINLKIIVIDNKSSDNTVSLIKDKFPLIELHLSESNLGFGAANNIGYKIALEDNAEYIFLLNQDTVSYPNTIQKLIQIADSDDGIGVVSPIHLNDSGDKLDFKFEQYITAKTCPDYISDVTLGNLKECYSIGFVNAAAWLIKIKTVQAVGGLFSSAFFHYGEDVNFIGRLLYFNFKNVIVPNAYIHHCREERKGELSKDYMNKMVDVTKVTIMLSIRASYNTCCKDIFRFAMQQLINLKFINFLKLVTYPIINFGTINRYRNSYKEGKKII